MSKPIRIGHGVEIRDAGDAYEILATGDPAKRIAETAIDVVNARYSREDSSWEDLKRAIGDLADQLISAGYGGKIVHQAGGTATSRGKR